MNNQKFKRVISIILIVTMTFCSQGFSVLANAVPNVIDEDAETKVLSQSRNYYLEYKEEQTLILKTNNQNASEEENKIESEVEKSSEETFSSCRACQHI